MKLGQEYQGHKLGNFYEENIGIGFNKYRKSEIKFNVHFKPSFRFGERWIKEKKGHVCGESAPHFGVLRLNTYSPGICEEKRLDEEKRQVIPKSWFLQLFIHLLFWTRYSDHATKCFFVCVFL